MFAKFFPKAILYLLKDIRLYILIVPATLVLMTDMAVFQSISYAMAIVVSIVGTAHGIRQVLFPYVDMSDLLEKASASATGAAIIATALLMLMALMVLVTVFWVRG